MKLYVGEVIERVREIPNREEKVQFLRRNHSEALLCVLKLLYDKDVQFYTNKVPPYKKSNFVWGISDTNFYHTLRIFYCWMKTCPIAEKKKDTLLIQTLECLHPTEAGLLEYMIKKNIASVPGLTEKIVLEAFPGLYESPTLRQRLRLG